MTTARELLKELVSSVESSEEYLYKPALEALKKSRAFLAQSEQAGPAEDRHIGVEIDRLEGRLRSVIASMSAEPVAWRRNVSGGNEREYIGGRPHVPELWEPLYTAPPQDSDALQAKIDALMIEYCPDEMTPEQRENWARNQKPVSPEVAAEIDSAIAKEGK